MHLSDIVLRLQRHLVCSLFVKEHYASIKSTHNLQKHGDVMTALAVKFKEAKSSQIEEPDLEATVGSPLIA